MERDSTSAKVESTKCLNLALAYACNGGRFEIAKWLVSLGANDFNSALYSACWGGHLEIERWLAEEIDSRSSESANLRGGNIFNRYLGHNCIIKS